MEHQGDRKGRQRTRYRDPLAGLIVLTLGVLLLLGVTAVRFRLIEVEVKLGPWLNARAARAAAVAATVPAAPRPAPVKVVKTPVVPVASVPAAVAEKTAEAAETPAPPATAPRKALASAVAASRKVTECATSVTTAVNVDPTDGEIGGAHGLPDQVAYFKARTKACRSVASTASAPR